MANLINSGILPLTFVNEEDYDDIDQDDKLVIEDIIPEKAETSLLLEM